MNHSQEIKNAYLRKQRENRRFFAFEKLGRKCVDCGSTRDLEFDHIDPKTKLFSIGKIWSARWEVFLAELEKCQLKCKKCHLIKSNKEARERMLGTGKHGTMWMYHKHKCRCEKCVSYKHLHYLKYKAHRKSRRSGFDSLGRHNEI